MLWLVLVTSGGNSLFCKWSGFRHWKMFRNFLCYYQIRNEIFDCQVTKVDRFYRQVLSRPPACFLKPLSDIFPGLKGEPSLLHFKKKDMTWVNIFFFFKIQFIYFLIGAIHVWHFTFINAYWRYCVWYKWPVWGFNPYDCLKVGRKGGQ